MTTIVNISSDQSSSGGLPTPKIILSSDRSAPSVDIQLFDAGSNSNIGSFVLNRYPVAVATDLTKEQIENGVYIEMSVYNKAKRRYGDSNSSNGYKVPSPRISGVNPLGNKRTRGGSHTVSGGSGSHTPISVDRPNHYLVRNQNEVLPVWEYLHNRHTKQLVQYRDSTANIQTIEANIPIQGKRTTGGGAGSYHGYSARYRPYYFTFRYIMRDEKSEQFLVGPESHTIQMTATNHPFNYLELESSFYNQACNNLNPLYDARQMECHWENKN